MWKIIGGILGTILTIATLIGVYHVAVNYWEPKAHASEVKEGLERNIVITAKRLTEEIAVVADAFQSFSLQSDRRGIQKDLWDLEDRYGKPSIPFTCSMIEDLKEKERCRRLVNELELIDLQLEGG